MTNHTPEHASGSGLYPSQRARMIELLRSRGIQDQRVLRAMSEIPRHLFVPEALAAKAYGDHALPIGDMQTISQPYMVARMTELLEVNKDSTVLEIGAGSGYQTAVLSEVAGGVVAGWEGTPLNSSHLVNSYAGFFLKKKKQNKRM